jgi:nucleoside-diphosphate-sugar epimerase
MDGHSGIENREVKKGNTSNFQFVLSFLKTSSGEKHFIIHASSNVVYGGEPHPLKFLERIGFELFKGTCPFYNDRCFWKHFAALETNAYGFADIRITESLHNLSNLRS